MNQLKYGETYVCKRLRLLSFLYMKGFTPSAVMPDYDNPNFNVWAFDNSPELEAAIDEYFADKKRRREAMANNK